MPPLDPSHGRTRIQMEFPTGGRVSIDIEGDKEYFEIASRRLPSITKPLLLLPDSGGGQEEQPDLFSPNYNPTLIQQPEPTQLPYHQSHQPTQLASHNPYANPQFNPYPEPIQLPVPTEVQTIVQPTQIQPQSEIPYPQPNLPNSSNPTNPIHTLVPTLLDKSPTKLIQQTIEFSKSKQAKFLLASATNILLIAALLINPMSRKFFSWIPLVGQPLESFGNSLAQGYAKFLTPPKPQPQQPQPKKP